MQHNPMELNFRQIIYIKFADAKKKEVCSWEYKLGKKGKKECLCSIVMLALSFLRSGRYKPASPLKKNYLALNQYI